MKHDENGFVNGSTVKLNNVPGDSITAVAINGKGNIYGVNVQTINNVEFPVSKTPVTVREVLLVTFVDNLTSKALDVKSEE